MILTDNWRVFVDYAFNETRHQIEMAEHDEDPTLPLWTEAHNRAREMALFWQAVRPTARNLCQYTLGHISYARKVKKIYALIP